MPDTMPANRPISAMPRAPINPTVIVTGHARPAERHATVGAPGAYVSIVGVASSGPVGRLPSGIRRHRNFNGRRDATEPIWRMQPREF